MTTPDEAAALDHDDLTFDKLTPADIGATIEVYGTGQTVDVEPIIGELVEIVSPTTIKVQREGKPFSTTITTPWVHGVLRYRVLEPAPAAEEPVITPVDMKLMRELISVSDQRKLAEGQVDDLEKREEELSEKLVEQFAANGVEKLTVDGRTLYTHTQTGASFKERSADEGGGRYAVGDLVPVFRKLGMGHHIKPETVNWQTISAILREYREAEEPVPAELARMVELKGSPQIRVRAPRKTRKG